MNDPSDYWWPVARSAALRTRPLAVTVLNNRLALFRGRSGRVACLTDCCPHRQAPLSAGKVRGEDIRCAYHGWSFDASGACTGIPGLGCGLPRPDGAKSFHVVEAYGLVWVCLSAKPRQPAPSAPAMRDSADCFVMQTTVLATVQEATENFLDATHTHFVHPGLVRFNSTRNPVAASIRPISEGVEVRYEDGRKQTGLISGLLEKERSHSIGRFRLPGIAEIEYHDRRGCTICFSAYFTPMDDDRLTAFVLVLTRRGLMPAWLKWMVLRPVFGIVLRQDLRIVELQHRNRRHFPDAMPRSSEVDLLGPHIKNLLDGRPDRIVAREQTLLI